MSQCRDSQLPPHAKFADAPKEKISLYPPGAFPYRPNAKSGNSTSDGAFGWSPHGYQGYHAHVTAIDEEIGRILRRLSELGHPATEPPADPVPAERSGRH